MRVLILCGQRSEASAFAKSQGWKPTQWVYPVAAMSVQGGRYDRIVELTSFGSKPNRHSILQALRPHLRTYRKVKVEQVGGPHVEIPEPVPTEPRPDMIVTAVPDDAPVPDFHRDLVAQVLPHKAHSETAPDGQTDIFEQIADHEADAPPGVPESDLDFAAERAKPAPAPSFFDEL